MYERLTKWEVEGCASVNGCSPIDKDMAKAINRLCDLEDKICEGRRVEVPCKIGDEVWINRYLHSKLLPQKGIVSEMKFLPNMELQIVVKYVGRGRWGKDIFATPERQNKSSATYTITENFSRQKG